VNENADPQDCVEFKSCVCVRGRINKGGLTSRRPLLTTFARQSQTLAVDGGHHAAGTQHSRGNAAQ
jgi:hypothetical protein